MSCEIGLDMNQIHHSHSSIHSFPCSSFIVHAPKPCQSIIPLPQPLLFNHISTEGKILRVDGPILVHDLVSSFKVLKGFPGPLICPDVSGNFLFSPPNIPSSRSVLPIAPSIPPLCLGSVSTLLPLKQNPHLGSKQQTFMSQS